MMSSYVQALGARVFAMASNLICGVIALKLYGRLSPEAYGVVAVALTVMGYLPLMDGGFRTTINRAVLAEPTPEERSKLLRFGQVFYSWLGLGILGVAIVLMVGYAFTPPGRSSGQPLAFFLALALAGGLSVISSIQTGVLIGLQSQTSSFLLTALGAWVGLASLWTVLVKGGGVWAFPISTLCAVVAVYPVAFWLIRRFQPGLPILAFSAGTSFWGCFKRLRSDAWHCFQSQTSIVVLYTIDIVMVGMICSAREAAIYVVLSRLFGILRGFLQALSEISWPLIAQRGWGNKRLNHVLNRMNAWTVGSVTGALCLTLAPFCQWYIGQAWAMPNYLVWLLAARFMITSLASPAAYLLYGAGDFRSISRYLNRELLAAVLLALVAGPLFGLVGIATAFLASTAFGTLYPIFRAYAVKTGEPALGTVLEIWLRGGAGLTISLLCTSLSLTRLAAGTQLVLAGALGVAGGLGACLIWSAIRMIREQESVSSRTVLKLMNSL
jgi:O-antigen/teichoic acid export membrane protein